MADIDRINRKILQILESDGRISNTELASRAGLSAAACLRRVQEMERNGVIRGYRALLDRDAMGRGFTAIVGVALSNHQLDSQLTFEKAILDAPQVRACHNVTGNYEYILRIEVADLNAYKQFHAEVLGTIPGVQGITSFISMDTVKDEP